MGFQDMKGLFPGGWSVAAKLCDSCKSSAATIFCRFDSLFLCLSCDAKLHCACRHERVWMCEVCEQAPAAVTCKADAAALCVTCDADIHSANPLAGRHERVPIEPFYDSAASIVKSSAPAASMNLFNHAGVNNVSDELDTVNWMIPSSALDSKLLEITSVKNGDLFSSEMDPFLDFEFPSSVDKFQHQGTDSVVPAPATPMPVPVINHNTENCFEIAFGKSKISPFSFPTQSISQSVSSSEVGVVPDGNSMSDVSYPFGRNLNGIPESSVPVSASTNQVSVIDREARVLRYREKRKNRKFQKTIRYASRKAYAETRPRIKGRFAKRSEIGAEMEQIYGSSSPVFGVVPTL